MPQRDSEILRKRVALTPTTLASLSNLRKPGQTFNDTIVELIFEHQQTQLAIDLDGIDATEKIVAWHRAS